MHVSLVCRHWRQLALAAPHLWNNVHLVFARMDPVIIGHFFTRAAPLALSFRSDSDHIRSLLNPAVYTVLAAHASQIREFIVPNALTQFLETQHATTVLTKPFPQLETLWIVRTTPVPAPFLGHYAPNLTTLCIPASALPLTGELPTLRAVTTFRVMLGLLDRAQLERVLALCPNVKRLLRAASFRDSVSVTHRYPVALDTLTFSDMRSPELALFAAPLLEMLDAPSIRHIVMLDTHMDAMTLVVAQLRAIVHALFDFTEGYVELVDERGFLRCFYHCCFWGEEPLRHICTLSSIRWRLQSLVVVGIPPAGCPLPPVHDLRSLTIGVSQDDTTLPAFALERPFSLLSELRIARYDYRAFPRRADGSDVFEMSARAVSEFVATLLEHTPSLEQLHLDSVRLDGDAPPRLRVLHTASRMTPAPYGGDLPYDLDHPLEYEALRMRRRRERQSHP